MTVLCKNCSPRKECFYYQNGENRTECKFYKPMTEQEYIQTCTTEQLGKFLAGILNTNPCGYLLSCNECGLNDRCCEDDYPSSKEAWMEWLKQPHTARSLRG